MPLIRALERGICGCTYGATSWATRGEADLIAATLGLVAGVKLLEVGAGSGWPALYLAAQSGCGVTLVDLPLSGLQIGMRLAVMAGLTTRRCGVVAADAAQLPFANATFARAAHGSPIVNIVTRWSTADR